MDFGKGVMGHISGRRWVGCGGLVVALVAAVSIGGVPAAAASTYSLLATVSAGAEAYMVAVDPTTNTAYVTNPGANQVTVIDGATFTATATVAVGGGPQGVAVNPRNHRVYVTNGNDNTVSVIDEATNSVIATVPVGDTPFALSVNPVTNTVYVANLNGGTVSVIDSATNTVSATVSVGTTAVGIAVNPATNTVYVADQFNSVVAVVDGGSNTVTTTIPVPGFTAAMAVNPATNTVYVNNYAGAGSIVVIDGATNSVSTSILAGSVTWGLAVDPATNIIYKTNSFDDTVTAIDGETNTVVTTLPVGDSPIGVAVNTVKHTVYVANEGDDTVSVIQGALPPAVATSRPAPVVTRAGGADRYTTAVAMSQAAFPDKSAGAVVLASGLSYPDALVGVPLASGKNEPILLAAGATLPDVTRVELTRVLPAGRTVYLLGGAAAIPASVAKQLTSLGYTVTRIAGEDRYRTAVAVADTLGDPTTALLASGTSFPDALVAGPAAAHIGGVVLLTDGDTMSAATSAYLASHQGTVFAVGGPAAAASQDATKVVGIDRYETAAETAKQFFVNPTAVSIANGSTFADALRGGASLDGPLLLTTSPGLATPASAYLASVRSSLSNVTVVGGTAALADSTMSAAENALGQ
jgi:YVTN family beta-propeller protein